MTRHGQRAIVRSLAFVLAFADAVKHTILIDLLGKRLSGEFFDIRLKSRYAEHLSARKPVAYGTCSKTLQETLLARQIYMNGDNQLSGLRHDKRLA